MRLKHSKLTASQTSRLCEHFVAERRPEPPPNWSALTQSAAMLLYHRLREIIAVQIKDKVSHPSRDRGRRVPFRRRTQGKRGRGAGKVPVFGILKRGAASTPR